MYGWQQQQQQQQDASTPEDSNQFVDDLVCKLLEEDPMDINSALFGDAGGGGGGGGRPRRLQPPPALPQDQGVESGMGCDGGVEGGLGLHHHHHHHSTSHQLRMPLQTLNGFNNMQASYYT